MSTAATATEAILYRDPEYGALSLIFEGRDIVVIDHGSLDAVRLMGILSSQAKRRAGATASESRWEPTVHPKILRANIERGMRDVGYTEDRLAERAILVVDEATARAPDLPARGRVYVSEAVERAIGAQLDAALARVMPHLPGRVESTTMEAYPRPYRRSSTTRAPLPFFMARATVRLPEGWDGGSVPPDVSSAAGGARDVQSVVEAWREVLKPMADSVVRATAAVSGEHLVMEAAICPPEAVLEHFEAARLPAFESAALRGYRMAQIKLQVPITEKDLATLRARADSCTGAYRVEADGDVLTVAVPSAVEGFHLGDQAFRERVNWIMQEVVEYGPILEWVGHMEEGAPPMPTSGGLAEDRLEQEAGPEV